MKKNTAFKIDSEFYDHFDFIDGTHPWQKAAPNGFVLYRVRKIFGGKVTYFNFKLAKEMGLIEENHPHAINNYLENKLLDTFCLQIINEYDELSKRKFDESHIKLNKYMATRYLQLQHSNKKGETSGDGRGIWNGIVTFQNKTWDISSRGTGVTCLAPGAVQAKKPLKTGDEEFGYGCGLAELDELYGSAILSEIMHLQGFNTERVLCIIDSGKGTGIGVRAAPNLLRPAHVFPFLKQEKWQELKTSVDYLIKRQFENKEWNINPKNPKRYSLMAEKIAKDFAKFAAYLETDYVFAWLDWDGDNVLANAGIIDYGSVRQFGLRHDQYRYDDIERWSTTLNEQKVKARQIVQVYCQLADYLESKIKKPIRAFSQSKVLKDFDQEFLRSRNSRLLYKLGFDQTQRTAILEEADTFNKFFKHFSYFERAKIKGKPAKVADGINRPPLFNMKKIIRELPKLLSKNFELTGFTEEKFFDLIKSSLAQQMNLKMGEKHKKNAKKFVTLYKELLLISTEGKRLKFHLQKIHQRSLRLNKDDRITGNALIQIVDELLRLHKNGMPETEFQKIIDKIISQYYGLPEIKSKEALPPPKVSPILYSRILNLVEEYREDI